MSAAGGWDSKFFFARSTPDTQAHGYDAAAFGPTGRDPMSAGGCTTTTMPSVSIGGGRSNRIYAYAAGGVGNSACLPYAYTADGN